MTSAPTIRRVPRLVIGGVSSGVGKTLITAGLVRALKNRGLRVATFKAGPDFIDPSFLAAASGRACHNLDGWMMPRSAVRRVFADATRDADIAIIEGMMGLYDGRGPTGDDGSTAQLSRQLAAPVMLVLDASRASRSIAAVVTGFQRFDRRVRFAGVIANQVASPRHGEWTSQALEALTNVSVLGVIPRSDELGVGSRHLGLIQAGDLPQVEALLEHAASIVSEHLQLDRLLEAAAAAPPLAEPARRAAAPPRQAIRMAIARDEAFTFYYQDNLDQLGAGGATLVPFSPIHDAALPSDIAGIYLGGGYPELHAEALAANRSMIGSIKRAVERQIPIYAECGGFLYLLRSLQDLEGREHPLVGAVPLSARMEARRVALGYTEVTALRDSFILASGNQARGHEFHWSRLLDSVPPDSVAYRVTTSRESRDDGYVRGSIVASYVHLHFRSHPRLVSRWLHACRAWRKTSMIRSQS